MGTFEAPEGESTRQPKLPPEVDLDVRCAAAIDTPVLVTATDDVAEFVAKLVHYRSGRRDQPLLAYRVAGNDLDVRDLAACLHRHPLDPVTVLVSDVSRLSQDAQDFLEEWLVEQSQRPSPSVRLIAATHVWLHDLIERGEFSEGLFYRLNKIHIHPPWTVRVDPRSRSPHPAAHSRPAGGCDHLAGHTSEGVQ